MHRKFSVSKTQISIFFLKHQVILGLQDIETRHSRRALGGESAGIGTGERGMKSVDALLYRDVYRIISDRLERKATLLSQAIKNRIRPVSLNNVTSGFLISEIFKTHNVADSGRFFNLDMPGGRNMDCLSRKHQVVDTGNVKAFDMLQTALCHKVSREKYEVKDDYYNESCMSVYDSVSFHKSAMRWQTATGIYLWMTAESAVNLREVSQLFTYPKELSNLCSYGKKVLTENVYQRGGSMFLKQENTVNDFSENSVLFASATSAGTAKKVFSALWKNKGKSGDTLVYFPNYFGSHMTSCGARVVSFLREICQGILAGDRVWKRYILIRNTDP